MPKFLNQSSKDKASTLLKIIGMEDQVNELNNAENAAYNRRHAIGQIADQKRKYAAELPVFPDVPEEVISVSELIERQQAILIKNAENQKKRENVVKIEEEREKIRAKIDDITSKMEELSRDLEEMTGRYKDIQEDLAVAEKDAEELQDESTAELEESIRDIDEINTKVRANLDKEKAIQEADEISREYDKLTSEIEEIREKRKDLLKSAKLPLPDLSVENGELLYRNKAWDCMSSSEQMIVAVAIVRAINPKCGFVLLDKLEQLDKETLEEFDRWMESENLQGICTRVSTGDECEIIIEDGMAVKKSRKDVVQKAWKEGEF
jgi:chromosome segregation ATPase